MQVVAKLFPGDFGKMERTSIIEEGHPKKVMDVRSILAALDLTLSSLTQVRMGALAVIGSYKVNGVAELHSELVKSSLFP